MFTRLLLLFMVASCTFCSAPVTMTVRPAAEGQGREAPGPVGVTLVPLAEPWAGAEHDLTAYVLPVPVEVRNTGPWTVEVRAQDFVLVDERGHEVPPCALPQAPREATAAPPLRGPVFATVAPPPSADPDRELKFVGPAAPPPVSPEQQLSLPLGPLGPGQAVRGFLFFEQGPLGDLRRLPMLRLRFSPHTPDGPGGGPGNQPGGTIEARFQVERRAAP